MINTNRIVQAGDAISGVEGTAIQTDELLSEISRLYLDRCKALLENNTIVLQLLNHQIADLRERLRLL